VISMTLYSGAANRAERKAIKCEFPVAPAEREAILRAGKAWEKENGFGLEGDPREQPLAIYTRAILRGKIPAPGFVESHPMFAPSTLPRADPRMALVPLLEQQLQFSVETTALLLDRNR
jgi:hypothetical protein